MGGSGRCEGSTGVCCGNPHISFSPGRVLLAVVQRKRGGETKGEAWIL
jgi:hypothetical protein